MPTPAIHRWGNVTDCEPAFPKVPSVLHVTILLPCIPLLCYWQTLLWALLAGFWMWTNQSTLEIKPFRPWNLSVWNIPRNCCEVAVSLMLLTELFGAGSIAAAGCCCLLEVTMILEIRRSRDGWGPACLQRDITVIFRSHRRFYPGSPLRRAFVASSFLLGCCIAALIVIHRVAAGI